MSEFFAAILSPVNLVLTVMLTLCMGYWLLVAFGTLALDSLDIDLSMDTDVDAGDPGLDLKTGGGGMALGVMKFLNVGEVPIMILLSIFLVVMWVVGMLSHPLIGAWGVILQFLMLFPFAILATAITKILTQPLASIFKKMREEEEAERHLVLIGSRCTVISGEVNDRYGQVEISTKGSPLKLNARTGPGVPAVSKGAEAVIVSQHDEHTYLIRGF